MILPLPAVAPSLRSQSKGLAWVDEHGPLRRLALFRVLVGVLLLRHTLPFLERSRFFADRFYVPYSDAIPVPDRTLYFAMLLGICVAGVLVTMGLFTRVALAAALVLGTWQFLLNQLFYSNNRIFLLLCVLVLLFSPSHRALSLDAWRRKESPVATGPLWTQIVLRAQASLLYLASGGSKLVDSDWIGGWVLWTRLRIVLGGSHPLVMALSTVKPLLGASAVATEMFLGVALWIQKLRRLALWIGFWFHFLIEAMFSVHVFSYLMLGTYLLVASGAQRNRVVRYRAGSPWQEALASAFSALDWLAKLDLRPSDRLEVVRPDGGVHRGPFALAVAADAVPLLFPIAHPLTWLSQKAGVAAPPVPAPERERAPAPLALVAGGLLAAVVLYRDVAVGFGGYDKPVWAALVIVVLSLATARPALPAE